MVEQNCSGSKKEEEEEEEEEADVLPSTLRV
jgi:hypothetical protein